MMAVLRVDIDQMENIHICLKLDNHTIEARMKINDICLKKNLHAYIINYLY